MFGRFPNERNDAFGRLRNNNKNKAGNEANTNNKSPIFFQALPRRHIIILRSRNESNTIRVFNLCLRNCVIIIRRKKETMQRLNRM